MKYTGIFIILMAAITVMVIAASHATTTVTITCQPASACEHLNLTVNVP
jgi:hypothetical protein